MVHFQVYKPLFVLFLGLDFNSFPHVSWKPSSEVASAVKLPTGFSISSIFLSHLQIRISHLNVYIFKLSMSSLRASIVDILFSIPEYQITPKINGLKQ